MRTTLFVTAAALALAACNQGVSLTNATPEEAAKAAAASGEKIELRPGKWETKIEMVSMNMPEMKGMPAEFSDKLKAEAMKPRTISSCMTEKDAKEHGGRVFGGGDSKCKYDKYEMSGGRIEAVMTCPGNSGDMKLSMTGTFNSDDFTVEQSMEMPSPAGPVRSQAKLSGKRVGDCAPGEK